MIQRTQAKIESITPRSGKEGDIITLKGSGFDPYDPTRNNCVVVGGMGACARAEPSSTPTELKVRIGPVPAEHEGDVLMWPGVGAELHTGRLVFGRTSLQFSETALFRNGAPVTSAGVKFKLTQASPNTYGGRLETSPAARVELGGQEQGTVLRVAFPKDLALSGKKSVDVCIVLKEPTLAIDFTADITGNGKDAEECLRAIAKGIAVNADLIGERVFADVAQDPKSGAWSLFITKAYLTNGLATVRFR